MRFTNFDCSSLLASIVASATSPEPHPVRTLRKGA
jgi:hypothetical protein